jgi:hypothetical protein
MMVVQQDGEAVSAGRLLAASRGKTVSHSSHAGAERGAIPERRQALGAELIIPVGTILFAGYYLYTVWELPWQAKAAGLGIAGAMALVLLLLAIRFVGELAAGRADLGLGDLVVPRVTLAQRLGLLAAALAFVFAMPLIGFTLGLFLFLMTGMIILSGLSQLKSGLIIALLVSLAGYLLFIVFIQARFPHGPVEAFLGSLF